MVRQEAVNIRHKRAHITGRIVSVVVLVLLILPVSARGPRARYRPKTACSRPDAHLAQKYSLCRMSSVFTWHATTKGSGKCSLFDGRKANARKVCL